MFDFLHDPLAILFLAGVIVSLSGAVLNVWKATKNKKRSFLHKFIFPFCLVIYALILGTAFYFRSYSYYEIVMNGGVTADSKFVVDKYAEQKSNHFYSLYTVTSSGGLGLDDGLFRSYEKKEGLKLITKRNFVFLDGTLPDSDFDTSHAYILEYSVGFKKTGKNNEEILSSTKEMFTSSMNSAILIAEKELGKDLPVNVLTNDDGVRGDSAGLMMTLELIQQFGDKDLVGDHKICGTGTIMPDGRVGAIGALKMKLITADSLGFEYCFVSKDNYKDAKKIMSDNQLKLHVLPVENIDNALDFLKILD